MVCLLPGDMVFSKKVKVKWCINIAPFPCNMLKGALQFTI